MNTTTYGKISGVVGLVLLLSSTYTFFITSGSPWLTAGKAITGAVLLVLYFVTNWANFGQFATRKSTSQLAMSVVGSVALLAILVAANFIAARRNQSWDLTDKKIYSLAPQTTQALQGLKQKVEAIAFLPASHPYYDVVEELLQRYQREAPDKFTYVFKDPRKNPDLAARYKLKEGETRIVLARGEGDDQAQTAVRGISEQELTNAIIKLNAVGEQKVYFVTGHGEWPLDARGLGPDDAGNALTELRRSMSQEGYQAEPLNLAGQTEVPSDAALVVIAGAKSRLSDPEEQALRTYLAQGGRLAVFAEALMDGGLDKLLAEYGVQIDNGVVADSKFAIQSPYALIVQPDFLAEHETTELLKKLDLNLQLFTLRGLTLLREGLLEGVTTKPVVLSSPYAWEETVPSEQPELSSGEKTGPLVLVAASTRKVSPKARTDEARVIVFGDSELLVDAMWGIEGNRNLVMNALGWVTNQTNRITIRPPDRDISTLDLDREMMANIRFAATDLVPVLLLAIGAAIWQSRRNK